LLAVLVVARPVVLFAQHTQPRTPTRDSTLLAAESLFEQGQLAEAKAATEQFLTTHTSSIDAYNLLGIICSGQKDYDDALAAFERGLALDSNSVKTHINLANLYAAAGKADLAEKEFHRALAIAPSNRDANYNLGLLLLAKGQPAAAVPYLAHVHPPTIEAQMNLVRAYLQSANTALGLKLALQLSAEKPQDVQRHFTLGLLLASEKQYKAAQLELERADALQPETFEILYNLGQVFLRGKEYSRAELLLHRALKQRPDSAETMYMLAQVYNEESRSVDALDLLARAHKLAPENADIIFLLARISMSQNFYEDAIPLLESGLKIAPQRTDLLSALGESYFMSGKTDKAVEEFNKLIQLEPSARSYTFMGLCYRHLGRFDEARKYFEEGLKREPRNAACLFNLGFIEARQGNGAAAEEKFEQALHSNPDFSEALLELANLRMRDKQFAQAAELLRRYVNLSRDPAAGYYKLAMVERSMHQMEAAQRDLNVFQTLSKNSSSGPYPYQHLFDYLDNRSKFSAQQRAQLDVAELNEQIKKHPGQPQDLYLLAEAYLKLGERDPALETVAQLDQLSARDYRTQTGVGVLLAQHRLYDQAIVHFQNALEINPNSDEIIFDLADAYFRKRLYSEALTTLKKISPEGQRDNTCLSLLADTYAHLGDATKSIGIFRDAIERNPDNDQYYLSLTLVELRSGEVHGAEETLKKGAVRIPASGKIQWGLGLVSALEGNTAQAAEQLERAVDLLPEWAGSYSTLGVFYYQTGQIDKAREVLKRFKGSNAGGLDIEKIEDALSHAPPTSPAPNQPLSMEARQQLLEVALLVADRTL
jgi:tetratricopeptide (TPR) repeat protein